MQPQRLSILGVGLLGGSIGLAVRALVKGCRTVGYGHRPATLRTALEVGAIDEAYDDPAAAVRGADLVILCTPVGLFGELLGQIGSALDRSAIVTDVGSTKRTVVAEGERLLKGGARFVGSHPMAGSEKRGVKFAQADLFKGARCILTPTARTDPQALDAVERFWRTLGMVTSRISPEDHDRLVSDVSHLPHAVAAALVAMQAEEAFPLAGKGFVDATRIAGGDGGLWRDIFVDNRDNLRASLQRLRGELDGLLASLEKGDADALKAWLDAAAERRERMLARRAGGAADGVIDSP